MTFSQDSRLLTSYFRFQDRNPDQAPFNNTLIFRQNPECGYYATAAQWEERFRRTIKDDARTMLILRPFGPVNFAYDLDDTEGPEITEEEILYWWREHGGTFDETIFTHTCRNLERLDIPLHQPEARDYFETETFRTGGFAARHVDEGGVSITLHPRYARPSAEAYGVLCHEMAHILLGHLGEVKTQPQKKQGKTVIKQIAKDSPA